MFRRASGEGYEGQFENGMYHGEGTLTYAKSREDGRSSESGTGRYGSLQDTEGEKKLRAAFETALYEQKALLDKSLAALLPGTPGRIDHHSLSQIYHPKAIEAHLQRWWLALPRQ